MARPIVEAVRDNSRRSGKQLRFVVRIVNRFGANPDFLVATWLVVQAGIFTTPIASAARFPMNCVITTVTRVGPVR